MIVRILESAGNDVNDPVVQAAGFLFFKNYQASPRDIAGTHGVIKLTFSL